MTPLCFAVSAVLATACLATGQSHSCPCAVSPPEAMRKLAKIDHRILPASGEEDSLFEDARDGRLERHSLNEACLLACGVADGRARRVCCEKLDRLELEARKATAGSKSSAEVAESLLRFLHAGAMAKGFRAEQTELHTLLDTGRFNCVSSAALYTVIGRRLGLKVSAIEVPEHMFVVVGADGRIFEVEATDPHGFDADPNRRVGPAKARASVGRRQVSDAGLAAVMAYNRGVALSNEKRYAEAIRTNLVSLALDPTNGNAGKNTVAVLANWPVEMVRSGRYTDAAAVLTVGRELAPKDEAVLNNARVVFDTWANVSMQCKDWAAAVGVYRTGLELLPGDRHLMKNLSYCREQLQR